jgi:hypothetical protein
MITPYNVIDSKRVEVNSKQYFEAISEGYIIYGNWKNLQGVEMCYAVLKQDKESAQRHEVWAKDTLNILKGMNNE